MDREQAKEYINGQEPIFLQKAQKGYICPKCGQGATKGNGITRASKRKNLWHCVDEKRERSILGLFAIYSGIPDDKEHYLEILERAAQYYNITIDSGKTGAAPRSAARQDLTPIRPLPGGADREPTAKETAAFIAQSARNIERTDYHRGITLETLKRFNVGYCPEWRHPKTVAKMKAEGKPLPPATPRLIIPTGAENYIARDTRKNIPPEQSSYSKLKVGSLQIFNSEALFSAVQPIYIVEGEIDALSIIDAGGEAIGLGTTTMTGRLLSLLEKQPPAQPLIIALDNDGAGEKAAAELVNGTKNPDGTQRQKGLQALEIPFFRCNIAGHYKDANEALQADRAAFIAAVKQGVKECTEQQSKAAQQEKERYLSTSAAAYIQKFMDGIADSVNTPYIPTGFNKLDDIFDGGLYEGLYIVGAISSLGKTTFITQIADQIAQNGTDVLIFSLEMARTELMSKSISRHTLQEVLSNGGDMRNAKTARGITTGKKYERYSNTEMELITSAIKTYAVYASRIYISEGIGDIGTAEIRDAVRKHIAFTGNTPVVVIDYLQILAPADVRATDKQNTDKAVMELKRISRDFKLPILGISSFNRENYSNAVTMAAFKESGAIEYSSDVLIGLQLKGAGEKGFNATEEKRKNPREVELVILKNRNGRTGDTVDFSYYPMFNYFVEQGAK